MSGHRKTKRESDLEHALGGLLDALDRQHLDGRAPGKFTYSLRVNEFRAVGRGLLRRNPQLRKEHAARTISA